MLNDFVGLQFQIVFSTGKVDGVDSSVDLGYGKLTVSEVSVRVWAMSSKGRVPRLSIFIAFFVRCYSLRHEAMGTNLKSIALGSHFMT